MQKPGRKLNNMKGLVKDKAKLSVYKTWSPSQKALVIGPLALAFIIIMILCYVTGIWMHDNAHDFFKFF